MNPYLAVVVISLVAVWLLNILSGILDLKNQPAAPPDAFADAFAPDVFARSKTYLGVQVRFSAVRDTVLTTATLGFILAGGFEAMDQWARGLGYSPIPTGLLFFAALMFIADMAGLPFDIYHTFVIEDRFGFNATTPVTFVLDKLKGWLLAALIGGPLLAGILWFFQAAGWWAWLACWGLVTAMSLGLTYVAPTWILPLFNTFTPLPEGELRTAIEGLAEREGFELTGIFLMDGSKRSSKANAFFTGLGKKKRIALYDTLVESQTPNEITAILAHEIGHSKLGHIKRRLVVSVLKTAAIFYLMSLVLKTAGVQEAFGLTQTSVHAGLAVFALLYTPIGLPLSVLAQWSSRKHEREADAFAARAADPRSLASALVKLAAKNLADLFPHRLTIWLHHSHPPVPERVATLMTTV